MQNNAPLWHPLNLRRRGGDDRSLADSGIKHDPGQIGKYLG
jgi:hypothetical protein